MLNKVELKPLHRDAIVPTYATRGSACFDLYAVEPVTISPGHYAVIRTGWAIRPPKGFRLDIFGRSGSGFNHGIRLANCVGKVDEDYTGEVMVCLHNDRADHFVVRKGDRIAQAEINPVHRVEFAVVDELPSTERGNGGFGSTGK